MKMEIKVWECTYRLTGTVQLIQPLLPGLDHFSSVTGDSSVHRW